MMAVSTERTTMATNMSGLRVFVNAASGKPASDPVDNESIVSVFYSRRGNGPIYRWLYEEKLAHWRSLRMHTSDFETQKLSNASWKSVPETLQAQLGAHYLD